MSQPWDLTIECSRHVAKLDSVSSSCRLAPAEELQILDSDKVATSSESPAYDKDVHSEYCMALCYNRQQQLGAILSSAIDEGSGGGKIEVKCRTPHRVLSTNWPFYHDGTVFGEAYMQLQEVVMSPDGDNALTAEVRNQSHLISVLTSPKDCPLPFHSSSLNQMSGGDKVDPPRGGWLVIVVFHTLWSANSIATLPSIIDIIPTFQDVATFYSVRADGEGMVALSRSFKVVDFPTIVVLRGGQEIDRIVGKTKIAEQLVACLSLRVTDDDKMAHAKRRERARRAAAIAQGQDPDLVEDEGEAKGALEVSTGLLH